MELKSPAFPAGASYPEKYTRDEENMSPPLEWSNVPEDTQEFALIFERETPETREPFAHWVAYGIPADTRSLPEGIRRAEKDLEEPIVQGINDGGTPGYDGPTGEVRQEHRYRFRLFALDEKLDLNPELKRGSVMSAIQDHILAEAVLPTRYQRSR